MTLVDKGSGRATGRRMREGSKADTRLVWSEARSVFLACNPCALHSGFVPPRTARRRLQEPAGRLVGAKHRGRPEESGCNRVGLQTEGWVAAERTERQEAEGCVGGGNGGKEGRPFP